MVVPISAQIRFIGITYHMHSLYYLTKISILATPKIACISGPSLLSLIESTDSMMMVDSWNSVQNLPLLHEVYKLLMWPGCVNFSGFMTLCCGLLKLIHCQWHTLYFLSRMGCALLSLLYSFLDSYSSAKCAILIPLGCTSTVYLILR